MLVVFVGTGIHYAYESTLKPALRIGGGDDGVRSAHARVRAIGTNQSGPMKIAGFAARIPLHFDPVTGETLRTAAVIAIANDDSFEKKLPA